MTSGPRSLRSNLLAGITAGLAPTLLDLAGRPANPEAQGKSLSPLLNGQRVVGPRWDYAHTEFGYAHNYQRSIIGERYKLVYVPDPDDRKVVKGRELELYDLEKDPGETHNLIDEKPLESTFCLLSMGAS